MDQRWHYRNVKHNAERSLLRRARLRSWVNEQKRTSGCTECGETDPRCLDCHHVDPASKTRAIGEMVTHGHGQDSLREEMEKCVVLCANCHRMEHGEVPKNPDSERERQRVWLVDYQCEVGGCQRCSETDPRCLVFHHSGKKNATVARLVADSTSWAELWTEVERCRVLCSNCRMGAPDASQITTRISATTIYYPPRSPIV